MAALRFSLSIPLAAAVSLPATIMQITPPNNRRVRLLSVELRTDGATPGDAPIGLEIGRITSIASGFYASPVTALLCVAAETVQTIGAKWSTEQSYGAPIASTSMHPQASMLWRPGGKGLLLAGAVEVGIRQVSGPLVAILAQVILEE